jgi:hydrogenase maturation protease
VSGSARPAGLVALVGGVSELYQGDLDLGRVVVERLRQRDLPDTVVVEDMHYGAIQVSQLLEELRPDALVLVGAKARGRPPGTIERRRVADLDLRVNDVQTSVGDAAVGYVDLDLLLDVAWGFGCLPDRTVVLEVEPAVVGPGEGMSDVVSALVDELVARVVEEADRTPLFDLVDLVEQRVVDPAMDTSIATEAMRDLVRELRGLDRTGHWGRTFAEKDRLRFAIAEGMTSATMEHADWGLWWGVIEEIERLGHRSVDRPL